MAICYSYAVPSVCNEFGFFLFLHPSDTVLGWFCSLPPLSAGDRALCNTLLLSIIGKGFSSR